MQLLSVVAVLFRVLAVGVLIVGGIVVKALARRNPLPALLVLVAILALAALLWGVKSFVLLIIRDNAREQPSRGVAWMKLVLGLILFGFFLAGVEIDGGFVPWGNDTLIGVLRTGHTGYLQPLLYGLAVAFGAVWLLSGTLGLLGKRRGWGICLGLAALILTLCGIGAPALSSVHQIPFPSEDTYNEVAALAFSPDGTRLAVAGKGEARGVTIWDVASHQQVLSLKHGSSNKARKVFFSADGQRIAAQFEGSYPSGSFQIWDANSGTKINGYEIQGHAAAFSPDGKFTSSVSSLDVILQEVDTGKVFAKINHPGSIQTLAFSPDSRHLVVGGSRKKDEGMLLVWSVDTREQVRSLSTPRGGIVRAVYSRDGGRLAATTSIEEPRGVIVTVWDMKTGEVVSTIDQKGNFFFGLAFHPNGRYLAVTEMGPAWIWDTATREAIVRLPGEHGTVGSVDYSPDGNLLAWGGKRVVLWDVSKLGK